MFFFYTKHTQSWCLVSSTKSCCYCFYVNFSLKEVERFIFVEADKKNVEDEIKRAVRYGKYKLHHSLLTKSSELYNLANDPKERFNIASEKSSIVDSLLVELKKFMQMSNREEESVDLTSEEIEKLKRLGYI